MRRSFSAVARGRARLRRSSLFVPAGRMDKFLPKALASSADSIILDLEDSVAARDKDDARRAVGAWLASRPDVGGKEVVVRVNGAAAIEDLAAVLGRGAWPDALMVPKVASAACLEGFDALVRACEANAGRAAGEGVGVVAIATEVPAGALNLPAIAAGPRVVAATWGAEDIAVELGSTRKYVETDGVKSYAPLFEHLRIQTLLACRAAGVQALDGVYTDVRDAAGLRNEAGDAAAMGFDGKMCLHPDQLAPTHAPLRLCGGRARARPVVAAPSATRGRRGARGRGHGRPAPPPRRAARCWTAPRPSTPLAARARRGSARARGLYLEDLNVGRVVEHALTRTVTETDNVLATTLSLNPAQLHLDHDGGEGDAPLRARPLSARVRPRARPSARLASRGGMSADNNKKSGSGGGGGRKRRPRNKKNKPDESKSRDQSPRSAGEDFEERALPGEEHLPMEAPVASPPSLAGSVALDREAAALLKARIRELEQSAADARRAEAAALKLRGRVEPAPGEAARRSSHVDALRAAHAEVEEGLRAEVEQLRAAGGGDARRRRARRAPRRVAIDRELERAELERAAGGEDARIAHLKELSDTADAAAEELEAAAGGPEPPDVEALEKKIKAALVVKLKEKLKAKEEARSVAKAEADKEESDKDRHYRKKDSLRAFDNAMKQLEAAEAAKAALAERLGAARRPRRRRRRAPGRPRRARGARAGDGGAALQAAVAEAEAAKEAAVRGELIAKFKDKLAGADALGEGVRGGAVAAAAEDAREAAVREELIAKLKDKLAKAKQADAEKADAALADAAAEVEEATSAALRAAHDRAVAALTEARDAEAAAAAEAARPRRRRAARTREATKAVDYERLKEAEAHKDAAAAFAARVADLEAKAATRETAARVAAEAAEARAALANGHACELEELADSHETELAQQLAAKQASHDAAAAKLAAAYDAAKQTLASTDAASRRHEARASALDAELAKARDDHSRELRATKEDLALKHRADKEAAVLAAKWGGDDDAFARPRTAAQPAAADGRLAELKATHAIQLRRVESENVALKNQLADLRAAHESLAARNALAACDVASLQPRVLLAAQGCGSAVSRNFDRIMNSDCLPNPIAVASQSMAR
ncbi:citrate lyase [Aureococcus anophagefferens]|uniref:Citrate lyase n=1 Tax=Aureococcus anophagefferens TaxID=44056 RepID=A0ABR1G482_AURAN